MTRGGDAVQLSIEKSSVIQGKGCSPTSIMTVTSDNELQLSANRDADKLKPEENQSPPQITINPVPGWGNLDSDAEGNVSGKDGVGGCLREAGAAQADPARQKAISTQRGEAWVLV